MNLTEIKTKATVFLKLLTIALFIVSCTNTAKHTTVTDSDSQPEPQQISEDSLFTLVQERTFQYFWDGAEPNSGMARERYHVDGVYPQDERHIVALGGSGFGVMAMIVGMERNFISFDEGVQRLQRIVNFLENADRFHGVWPHWLNGETGRVKPFSPRDDGGDLVETAYMAQGLLTAREYLRQHNETELADQIDRLWREIEWDWYRRGGENVLYWHWSPNHGWAMDFPLEGYNEVLITYILAASSPTHGIPAEVYHEGWARSGEITSDQTTYGYDLVLSHNGSPEYGGPLFWAHYSYLGLDPRDLVDRYANYWDLNRNHTLINRQWCVENPNNYEGHGPKNWGLTASYTRSDDGSVGYAAHHPEQDRGVITPTAALSSFPYTPEYSMEFMRNLYDNYRDQVFGPYGFYDAYSLEYDWFPQRYLAIDQGPIVVMMENHRTGLLWDLFMSAPEIQDGLRKLGFESPHLDDGDE